MDVSDNEWMVNSYYDHSNLFLNIKIKTYPLENSTFTNTNLNALSSYQINVLNIYTIVLTSISLTFLSVYFIAFIFSSKKYRTFSNELIFYICLCEFVGSIFNILNDENKYDAKCIIHSIGKTAFPIASMLLGTLIQYTVFATLKKIIKVSNNLIKLRIIYLSISFGIPTIFVIM